MRWTPGGSSDDVEDRRDDSGSGGMQFGGFHLGIGGLIIVFILSLVFHRNFFALLGSGSGEAPVAVGQQDRTQGSPANREQDKAEQPLVQAGTFFLYDTQETGSIFLPGEGAILHQAKLVLFRNSIDSGCGMPQSV